MKKTAVLDANIILRYILNDNKELADKAALYLTEYSVFITNEVIAEVVYVLSGKIYNIDRNTIKTALLTFLYEVNSQNESNDIVVEGLKIYADCKLDFVDCLLCAYRKVFGYDICTFDKELIKELKRIPINPDVY